MKTKPRQAETIRRALLSGRPVDAVTASAEGVWRLSSIIHRLRRRGWPIIAARDRNNGLAHYSLPINWTPNE